MHRARRVFVAVPVLGLAALTACGEGTSDAGASAPPSSATSAPAAAPSTGAPSPATDSALVLGPDGLGPLKLGMSAAEAAGTGLVPAITSEPSPGGCVWSELSGAPDGEEAYAVHSATYGVAAVDAYAGVRTPEGISLGSPVTAVEQAYPDWRLDEGTSRGYARVPGNGQFVYRIAADAGAVTDLTLQHGQQDCYE